MLNTYEITKLKRLIAKAKQSGIEASWAGALDPADAKEIRQWAADDEAALMKYLGELSARKSGP